MSEVSKEYDFNCVEEKWVESWDSSIYYFDWQSDKPQYIIDTPPPYPTGNFHIGNALNWCYIDYVARYKRMRGYNVMFPQGWDCHGLPTEVKVEEINHITKNQVPREEFRRLCEKLTEEAIERFHQSMGRLGLSIDWSNEYVTMRPEYYVKTQTSFVRMHDRGQIYRDDHPVNWCPRCGTAIAFAEVEYDSRTTNLNYMRFVSADGEMQIATSRPELLPACVAVAVHPDDQRYQSFIGKKVRVPLFDYEVPVLADPVVDTAFGTGIVMICTFGDRQDVRWWMEHHLPLRQAIDREGRLTALAGPYAGCSVDQAKERIIRDMQKEGIVFKQEPLEQNVGLCWRCKTPIEILSERQWFVRINPEEIKKTAEEIEWIPPHMQVRLKNWADSVEWDWCISRQRIFATPIPVWYCRSCGEVLVAKEEWLPLDPNQTRPPIRCRCGSDDFIPEKDVLDTWMDSSISALAVAGWPDRKDLRMPTQLRPQGHDIIRTWAFYTILRTKALQGVRPWDTILINGMALGEDGHKMSKSLNNFIRPEEVFATNGADALRQWGAMGGSPGNDIMFQWKEITAASRFQQKLWSIFRFALPLIANVEATPGQVDRWLLGELDRLVIKATKAMEAFQFDETMKAIRGFAWETLADNYIELVKARLYGPDSPEKRAAQSTLYRAIETVARLMAPFTPFISEEIFHTLTGQSVHVQNWPEPEGIEVDPAGLTIKEIAAAIRRYKAEKGMALNAPLPGIVVYSELGLETIDLSGVANSSVESRAGKPEIEMKPVAAKPQIKIIGPRFKDKSGRIIRALTAMNPAQAAEQKASGSIRVDVDGESIELPAEAVEIETETLSAGLAVDVLRLDGASVLVRR
ncbi:MAG TPA: valine--tRNA ligase [Methanothrix sp.]|nr:valine--tRNA ligase [Methanothrix sp.]HUM80203.1 valine--tRNA ligase [Methanothrix sp.]